MKQMSRWLKITEQARLTLEGLKVHMEIMVTREIKKAQDQEVGWETIFKPLKLELREMLFKFRKNLSLKKAKVDHKEESQTKVISLFKLFLEN